MAMENENEMHRGAVDTSRVANLWVGMVGDVMDTKLAPADAKLVRALALNIMFRWQNMAKTSDDFKRIYIEHKQAAQAYIVAVVEATRLMGALQKLDNWGRV